MMCPGERPCVMLLKRTLAETHDLDIFSATSLEQDQAHVRVLDQHGHDDQVAALILWIRIARTATVGALQKPVIRQIVTE